MFEVHSKTTSDASVVLFRKWAGLSPILCIWEKLIEETSILLRKLKTRVPKLREAFIKGKQTIDDYKCVAFNVDLPIQLKACSISFNDI